MSFISDKVCALNAELEELFRPEAAYFHLLRAASAGEEAELQPRPSSLKGDMDSLLPDGEKGGDADEASRVGGFTSRRTAVLPRSLPDTTPDVFTSRRLVSSSASTMPSVSQRQRPGAPAQASAKECAVIWDAIQQLSRAGPSYFKFSLVSLDGLLNCVCQTLHGCAAASDIGVGDHDDDSVFAAEDIELTDVDHGDLAGSPGTDMGDGETHTIACLRRLSGSSASADDANLLALEWYFLCRCSIIVYAHVLERLLVATLPLAKDIAYWTYIRGSVTWTAVYAAQTIPNRVRSIVIHVYKRLLSHPSQAVGSPSNPRWAALTAMFRHPKRLLFASGLFAQNALMQVPATHLSVLGFIRREISHRLQRLKTFRAHQAACLGLLAGRGFELPTPNLSLLGVVRVPAQLAKSLAMMRTTLYQANGFAGSDLGTIDFLDMAKIEAATAPPLSAYQAYQQISQLIKLVSAHEQSTCKVTRTFGRPSRPVRYWLPTLFGYFGLRNFGKSVYERRVDLFGLGREIVHTGKGFVTNWIVKPWTDVWRTVRHTENRLQIASAHSLASDTESLERMVADFAAEHSHNRQMDEAMRQAVIENVRRGDLSAVLRRYEEEIRTPVRSALFGCLIRAVLIQVQKAKVDVDLTLAALDKLLRSNELNFAFLAAFPALLVAILAFRWLRRLWSRRWHIGERRAVGEVITTLRAIVRSLNRVNAPFSDGRAHHPSFKDEGYLLCQVHLLRSYSRYLPRGFPTGRAASRIAVSAAEVEDDVVDDFPAGPSPQLSPTRATTTPSRLDGSAGGRRRRVPPRPRDYNCDEGFVEDLRDLENTQLSIGQKLETARRMYLEGLLWVGRLR